MTQRDDALEMRQRGCSVRDIAESLGVPRSTVQDWTRPSSPTRTADEIMDVSKEREARAVSLFTTDGLSARAIGVELGISHMQVTRLLRRAGVLS